MSTPKWNPKTSRWSNELSDRAWLSRQEKIVVAVVALVFALVVAVFSWGCADQPWCRSTQVDVRTGKTVCVP